MPLAGTTGDEGGSGLPGWLPFAVGGVLAALAGAVYFAMRSRTPVLAVAQDPCDAACPAEKVSLRKRRWKIDHEQVGKDFVEAVGVEIQGPKLADGKAKCADDKGHCDHAEFVVTMKIEGKSGWEMATDVFGDPQLFSRNSTEKVMEDEKGAYDGKTSTATWRLPIACADKKCRVAGSNATSRTVELLLKSDDKPPKNIVRFRAKWECNVTSTGCCVMTSVGADCKEFKAQWWGTTLKTPEVTAAEAEKEK